MPVSIQWEERGVLLEFSGSVTLDDHQEAILVLLQDNRADDIRYVICDLAKRDPLGQEAVFQEENEVLAAFAAGIFERRHFIVADVVAHPVTAANSENYKTLAPHPFAVFTSIAEARSWIDGNLNPLD